MRRTLPIAALALTTAGCANFGGQPYAPVLTGTTWRLTELYDSQVTVPGGHRVPNMTFLEPSHVSAFTGCNTISGSYMQRVDELEFGTMASTMMACPDEMGALERRFLDALHDTTGVNRVGSTLELVGGDRVIARLTSNEAPREPIVAEEPPR